MLRHTKKAVLYAQDVMLVLEEDGTEVEDNDYFQSLPDNTTFILLFKGDRYRFFSLSGFILVVVC
jgi:hypothetical protein